MKLQPTTPFQFRVHTRFEFQVKAVYYYIFEGHNFDLQEKTTENNNNTIIAK